MATKNKEKLRAAQKKYRSRPEIRISKNAYNRKWRERHKEKLSQRRIDKQTQRTYYLKYTWGITEEQYQQMLTKQNGVCAICKEKERMLGARSKRIKALAIDHDHNTGKIRGLLCGFCNKMLGLAKEKSETLNTAARYLDFYKETETPW